MVLSWDWSDAPSYTVLCSVLPDGRAVFAEIPDHAAPRVPLEMWAEGEDTGYRLLAPYKLGRVVRASLEDC